MKAISILRRVIGIGESSSRLGVLLGGSPLSLFDMLLTTWGGSGTWCSFCGLHSWVVLCLLGPMFFNFVPCISPFLGCFGLFIISRVSSLKSFTYVWHSCLLASTLVLALCFFFPPFLGCFFSLKFGKVSSCSLCMVGYGIVEK